MGMHAQKAQEIEWMLVGHDHDNMKGKATMFEEWMEVHGRLEVGWRWR
jgi:hypothetical protein